jgi:hypothetical protein
MEQGKNAQENYERAYYPYNEQRYSTAVRSIDTVRSLHQTVISLRSALDESRQEIEKLKKQIIVNNEIQNAKHLAHITNESTHDIHSLDYRSLGEKINKLEDFYYDNKLSSSIAPKNLEEASSTAEHEQQSILAQSKLTRIDNEQGQTISVVPDITISTHPSGSTTGNMASRIDVKIKVSSNINVESNNEPSEVDSSEHSEITKENEEAQINDDRPNESCEESNRKQNEDSENEIYADNKSNTLNIDSKNVKIKVTSEENINVTKSVEKICIQQSSSEFLNLDIDELSEGDNSVFTEGATTPIMERMRQVEDIDTDGEGGEIHDDDQKEDEEKNDIPEEVDDIELIFSSDDNKDVLQEDLVSISEYEPWQAPGSSGTPVLTKFSSLTSEDREREYNEQRGIYRSAKLMKQRKGQTMSADSQATIEKRCLESADSLSFDNIENKNNCGNKSFSLEKDSSIEQATLSEDASLNLFKPTSLGLNKKWTNVNVLIETDISKVGISDNENILEMGRRNTCPNPPIYR